MRGSCPTEEPEETVAREVPAGSCQKGEPEGCQKGEPEGRSNVAREGWEPDAREKEELRGRWREVPRWFRTGSAAP